MTPGLFTSETEELTGGEKQLQEEMQLCLDRMAPAAKSKKKQPKTKAKRKQEAEQTTLFDDPSQITLFGDLAGATANCAIWVPRYDGSWACGMYAPSCEGQKSCLTDGGKGRLRACVKMKQVFSRAYMKEVLRCARYKAICTGSACMNETMPRPRKIAPPEDRPDPPESVIKSLAKSLAKDFNRTQKELGPILAREISRRGKIAPYRGKYLAEEYAEIPLHLKKRSGLPLDEMASEMGMDEAELMERIHQAYPKGKKTVRSRPWEDFQEEAYKYLTI